MKNNIILPRALILICILFYGCSTKVQNIEVTRIVPQTVVVTQIFQLPITTTPIPSTTPGNSPSTTPSPLHKPFITQTISVNPLTITPGILVADITIRPDVEQFISNQTIKDYLVMNYGIGVHGGKEFCGYQPLGMENDAKMIKLYLWVGCFEYYPNENGQIKQGTGSIIPVVLYVEWRHSQYRIVDTKDAGLGYSNLKNNFPPEIQKLVLIRDNPDAFNKATEKLMTEIDQQAKNFFGQ
jgi:hypothetical protein